VVTDAASLARILLQRNIEAALRRAKPAEKRAALARQP